LRKHAVSEKSEVCKHLTENFQHRIYFEHPKIPGVQMIRLGCVF